VSEQQIHVYVDHFNCAIVPRKKPCKNFIKEGFCSFGDRCYFDHSGGGPKANVYVNVQELAKLVEGGRKTEERFVASSVGSSQQRSLPVWNQWRGAGYTVRLEDRSFNNKEVGVDEILHGLLGELASKQFPTPRTLVLLTGDGNGNHGKSTFPNAVQNALRNGWNVELWAWKSSLSNRWKGFEENYPGRFSLHLFDPHKDALTSSGGGIGICNVFFFIIASLSWSYLLLFPSSSD
jgi:hypothetical protein